MTSPSARPALRVPPVVEYAARAAGFDRGRARRAVTLMLTSRECVMRDVAFIPLPSESGVDFLIWGPRGAFTVALLPPGNGRGPQLERLGDRVASLGGRICEIRAETPAHAVDQLQAMLRGGDGAPGADGGTSPCAKASGDRS